VSAGLSFRSAVCHSTAPFVIPQRRLSFRSAAEESAFVLLLLHFFSNASEALLMQ